MAAPGPFMNTPVSELSALFDQKTRRDQCRPFALQLARCQDAYGYPHHVTKCRDEHDDLHECSKATIGNARGHALRDLRKQLYTEGKIDQLYVSPPPDSISQTHGFSD